MIYINAPSAVGVVPHPSTASSRNQIKFRRGWTKGGPFSMDGCFSVYVLNTTEALFLFFKQRNLGEGKKRRRRRGTMDQKQTADRKKMDLTAGKGSTFLLRIQIVNTTL